VTSISQEIALFRVSTLFFFTTCSSKNFKEELSGIIGAVGPASRTFHALGYCPPLPLQKQLPNASITKPKKPVPKDPKSI